MTWSFEISFLVFLSVIFISGAIAGRLKFYLPMPFVMGVICCVGFASGVFPQDFIKSSNMIAVGTIAYNVLIIHSSTMINLSFIREQKKEAVICIVSSLILILVVGFGLSPILGRELALISPAAIIGSGATCAISSRLIMEANPQLAVYPWMIFMAQGIFAVPIISWAAKKKTALLCENYNKNITQQSKSSSSPPKKTPLYDKIPYIMKNTAYYLGLIMLVNVANRWLNATILAPLNLNINVTALILGFILCQLGVLEKSPLSKSDSFGLLMLGLMGLMANTLAYTPIYGIIMLLKPLVLVFVLATVVLVSCGIIAAKLNGFSIYRGILLTTNCMMGFPLNEFFIGQSLKSANSKEQAEYIRTELSKSLGIGTMLISNALSIVAMAGLAIIL